MRRTEYRSRRGASKSTAVSKGGRLRSAMLGSSRPAAIRREMCQVDKLRESRPMNPRIVLATAAVLAIGVSPGPGPDADAAQPADEDTAARGRREVATDRARENLRRLRRRLSEYPRH